MSTTDSGSEMSIKLFWKWMIGKFINFLLPSCGRKFGYEGLKTFPQGFLLVFSCSTQQVVHAYALPMPMRPCLWGASNLSVFAHTPYITKPIKAAKQSLHFLPFFFWVCWHQPNFLMPHCLEVAGIEPRTSWLQAISANHLHHGQRYIQSYLWSCFSFGGTDILMRDA